MSQSQAPPRLDDYLCFALHSAAQAVGRANKKVLDKLGLTYPQFLAMLVLWTEDDLTVGQIGDKLFLESNTLTPLLKRLEAAGLLRRVRDTADERQVRIRLTERGRALGETARGLKHEWVGKVFGEDCAAMRELREKVAAFRDRLVQAEA
ncbi:MarR family winged helix-turn-helix transcriptional regulator [Siccirubricoccus phaeus]|uniref:MarR family winged helix-turn-helix transcriptional regulator n=1 Tax=Siccirubricoccus phaeus TaxID=2595053 RepID=UPI0011F1A1D2|nr:MarR family transcriptional regulator [Siccirubricoccus phaeus]